MQDVLYCSYGFQCIMESNAEEPEYKIKFKLLFIETYCTCTHLNNSLL